MTSPESRASRRGARVNPLDSARSELDTLMTGEEYNGGLLVNSLAKLQRALLSSGLLPAEKAYDELSLASGRAAKNAQDNNDTETANTLTVMKDSFDLTKRYFSIDPQGTSRRSGPTRTSALPPMTRPKG